VHPFSHAKFGDLPTDVVSSTIIGIGECMRSRDYDSGFYFDLLVICFVSRVSFHFRRTRLLFTFVVPLGDGIIRGQPSDEEQEEEQEATENEPEQLPSPRSRPSSSPRPIGGKSTINPSASIRSGQGSGGSTPGKSNSAL